MGDKINKSIVAKNNSSISNSSIVNKMNINSKLNLSTVSLRTLIVGLVLLIASGLLIYLSDTSNGKRYLFSRIILSISSGLVLSGALQDKIKVTIKHNGFSIAAVGSAAVFIIIYFFNPAEMPIV